MENLWIEPNQGYQNNGGGVVVLLCPVSNLMQRYRWRFKTFKTFKPLNRSAPFMP